MPPRKTAPGELAGIVFLALLTLGSEVLPDRLSAVGGAAWLCPLAAGGIVYPAARLFARRPLPGRRLFAGTRYPTGARALAGVLLLWGVPATAAQAVRAGLRISDDLRGAPLLLTAALVLLAAWMAAGGLAALGRACRIFGMAVTLAFFCIVLFGLFGLRWDWILLWDRAAPAALLRGGWIALKTFSLGLYPLVLLEDLGEETKDGGRTRRRLFAVFPLLSAGVLLVTGRLGPGLAGRVDRSFFQMVSGLGFQGAFQRLEELVSALWLLGDLALLALLLLCLRRLLARAVKREESPAMGWFLAGLVLAAAPLSGLWDPWPGGPAFPAGELLSGAVLLVAAATAKKIKNLKKGA